MFTLSVCMIVKNEEATLERILCCAKQFADEIIIIDTGSTDATKNIAKKYTNFVYDFKWNSNFSDARNYSFSKATCEYIIWLDADDYITNENIQKIINLKNSSQKPDMFFCTYVTGKNFELSYFRERIVKREKNYRWQGFVHEAIIPSGEIKYEDIEIQHKKEKTNDVKRNLNIYKDALKKGIVFNAREQYYYSRELYYNNKINEAIKSFKKFLQMEGYAPDNLNARIILSDCYLIKNKFDKALNCLFEAIKIFNPTSELCCKIANIFQLKNKLFQAIFWYKAALICQPQTQGFVYKDYSSIIPCLELTKINYNLGKFEEAKKFHLIAKEISPENNAVIYNEQFFKD